jgi:hypothetical protein
MARTYDRAMARRRLVLALLVPAGVVASHAVGYLVAHPAPRAHAHALGSSHGHLPLVSGVALAALIAAVIVAVGAGLSGSSVGVPVQRLAIAQASAFLALEVAEHVYANRQPAALVAEPAVWVGLACAVLLARLAALVVDAGAAIGAVLGRRPRPTASAAPGPLVAGGVAPVEVAWTPRSERGPPRTSPSRH